MLTATAETRRLLRSPERLYYVNLTELVQLQKQKSYIGCTSEKIFEMKKDCFDVFVNNQEVRIKPEDSAALKLTASDGKLWQNLSMLSKLSRGPASMGAETDEESGGGGGGDKVVAEEHIKEFFRGLNADIFLTLKRHYNSKMRVEQLEEYMHLDRGDAEFVRELIRVYEFDIVIEKSKKLLCC